MSLSNHHRPDGGFRNPWPGGQPGGLRDFLKWTLVERRREPRRPDPDPSTFVRVAPAFTVPRTAPEELTITWVGHSSWLIQIAGLNVLTDPIWSKRASPVQFAGPRRWVPPAIEFDRLPPIDAVLLSLRSSRREYDLAHRRAISRGRLAGSASTWRFSEAPRSARHHRARLVAGKLSWCSGPDMRSGAALFRQDSRPP